MAVPLPPDAVQAVLDIGNETAAKYPRAWSKCHINETDPERYDFIILFARAALQSPVILATHRAGMNGKRGNPDDPSMDIMDFLVTGVTDLRDVTAADVVGGAGGPNPKIVYQDITDPNGAGAIWIDPFTKQTHHPYDQPEPTHSTLLGCSLFYGIRAFKENWACLRPNLKWIRDKLRADYVRSFGSVGSDDPSNPWRLAGVFMTWSNWESLCRDYIRMCFEEFGIKQHMVVTAGADPGWVEDAEIRDSCRRYRDAIGGIEHMIVLHESQNEYKVNAHPRLSPSHFVRMIGWELIPSLPGAAFALSSPDNIMGGFPDDAVTAAEVEKMHSGHPANAITEHWCRNSADLSLHRPMNLGPFSPANHWSTEPIGPYSSVVSSTDPQWLGSRYQLAIDNGYKGYTFHTDPGIWSNKLNANRADMGKWENIFDVENADAIAEVLSSIRLTGSGGSGGGGGTGGGGGSEVMRIPDRGDYMRACDETHQFYQAPEGLQRPEGLWIDGHPDYEGLAAWPYDVYVHERDRGKSHEDAMNTVRSNIRHSQEWQQKHPGETPF